MENHQASRLFGRNIFADAFQQFDEESFFSSLHHQVRNKSYFEKYQGFKTTLLVLSYLFNVASALTASYAVYWLTHQLTGIPTLSWIIAAVFLFFLEKIKRKSSTEFWQVLFFQRQLAAGWLALSLACLGLSLASSAFGVKEGTEDLGPGAELIATDSTAQEYRQRIAQLEDDNTRLEQQRNAQGEIYWPAQKEKEQNKKMIADLQSRILALDQKLEGHNEELSEEYRQEIQLTAWTLVYVTIAMELLFELCIAWIWYYYFRSYVERKKVIGLPEEEEPPHHSPTPSSQKSRQPNALDPALISQIVAATLEQMQQVPSPPPSSNGQHREEIIDQVKEVIRPIGFYTEAQRASQWHEDAHPYRKEKKASVQACTDVYREETDRYTVLHEYQKGGRTYQVPYTENQILSRIGQYERDIEEAIKREMGEEILANRRRWLAYWQGKLQELKGKQAGQ